MFFDDLKAPYGFPNILFLTDPENPEFFFAKNMAEAKKNSKKSEPVRYFDMISAFSHSEVSKFLKNFGSSWVTRGGIFFFR